MQFIAEARAALDNAKELFQRTRPVDDAAKLLSDMVALGGHIGLNARYTVVWRVFHVENVRRYNTGIVSVLLRKVNDLTSCC
jgi:hypothetical protein